MKKQFFAILILTSALLVGCRGIQTEKAPFHINPNMDFQAKYKAQHYSQNPPENTAVYGSNSISTEGDTREQFLKSDTRYYQGKNSDGTWVSRVPISVSSKELARGQERYNIYCAVCHDETGAGKGMVVKRGFTPPPTLWDARVLGYNDGQLFDVISNGIRTMPAYRKQISEKDRWSIVLYVRALQAAQSGSLSDVPAGTQLKYLETTTTSSITSSDNKNTN